MPNKIPTTAEVEKALVKFDESASFPQVVKVTDSASLQDAGALLRTVKGEQRRLTTLKKTMTDPIDAAKRAVADLFRPKEQALADLEAGLRQNMVSYEREEEARRRQAEARLRDEQAADQRKAEERAERLRAKGKEEQADAVLANVAPAPVLIADRPKVEGISMRGVWKAEVVDYPAFVAFVAAHLDVYPNFLEPNDSALGAFARQNKGSVTVPGLRVYEDRTVVARA